MVVRVLESRSPCSVEWRLTGRAVQWIVEAAISLRCVEVGVTDKSVPGYCARYARRLASANGHSRTVVGLVQKVGYGQPTQVIGRFSSQGWTFEPVAARALEFTPTAGRIGDPGAVVRLDLPGGVRHVFRLAPEGYISDWIAGTETTFDKLAKLGDALKWSGIDLGLVANGTSQWARDADRDDLDWKQRTARVVYRSTAVTVAQFGGSLLGGAAGATIGAGVGGVICPGAGHLAGGLAGKVLGGYYGAKGAGALANPLVDRTIDSIGQGDVAGLRADISELVTEVETFLTETGETVIDLVPALLRFLLPFSQ